MTDDPCLTSYRYVPPLQRLDPEDLTPEDLTPEDRECCVRDPLDAARDRGDDADSSPVRATVADTGPEGWGA